VTEELEERIIPKEERDKADDSDFAGKARSFPILKPEDVAAAAASLGRAGSDNYSTDQIKANIIRIAKRKGSAFVAKLPQAWKESEMPEELGGDLMDLTERAVARDGTIEMRLIQPGWGTSGYYPKEVLANDGPSVWPAGTHMYLDHPTESESRERPERSVKDLAAVTISAPEYRENGKVGPGLYARASVLPQWKDTIEALAPYIGVSIRASGTFESGEAEGRSGKIIKKLIKGASVDFVTKPGAGGQVLAVMESMRQESVPQNALSDVVSMEAVDTNAATSSSATSNFVQFDSGTAVPGTFTVSSGTTIYPAQETSVPEEESMEELQEATERISELETQLDEARKDNDDLRVRAERAEGALNIIKAQEAVKEMLDNVELPAAAKTRIVTKVATDAPMKEGELDKEALKETVEAEVKVEAEYIEAVTPKGKVTDQGGQAKEADGAEVKESLSKGLSRFFGLDQEAAKRAVERR